MSSSTAVSFGSVFFSAWPKGISMLSLPVVAAVRAGGSGTPVNFVAVAECTLQNFDDFLKEVCQNLFPGTVTFLVELDTGYLLASSVSQEVVSTVFTPSGAPGQARVAAVSAESTVIREIALELAGPASQGWARFSAAVPKQDFTDSVGGYYVTVRQVNLQGLRWALVVGTEINRWMEKVNSMVSLTIGLVGACIAGTCLVMFVSVHLVTRPLRRLVCEVQLLCRMDFAHVKSFPRSMLSEVDGLIHAFTTLAKNLAEYRKYMPDSLFSRDEANTVSEQGVPLPTQENNESAVGEPGVTLQTENVSVVQSPLAPQSTSRVVTVACFDMVGLEALALKEDLQTIHLQHSRYIDLIHTQVTGNRGLFDKVVGDRVFAVWNAPRRCPRAEYHAVRCALAVLRHCDATVGPPWETFCTSAATASPVASPPLPDSFADLGAVPAAPAEDDPSDSKELGDSSSASSSGSDNSGDRRPRDRKSVV
eukprot:RCo035426